MQMRKTDREKGYWGTKWCEIILSLRYQYTPTDNLAMSLLHSDTFHIKYIFSESLGIVDSNN